MALSVGTRLGPYEVLASLGAGGMGEVYRAKDTRLNRDVALKILPDSFSHDPERLARFRREAQVLASLNHPHIGAIYGLDEANPSTGSGQAAVQFLVLELVDGETLDKRIARGPIPIEDALPIARQIAEAVEAAHEKGVIHRDLKPSNIALTSDGQVKVLDFGLAKLAAPEDGSAGGPASPSMSPTITSPLVTGVGVLLGTAAYMSPEQVKGKEADKQSDVWAFGCVLLEMLTGRQTFRAETVAETLAVILMRDPDLKALPRNLHPKLEELLRRCLAKNRKERWHAIADVRVEVESIMVDPRGRHAQSAAAFRTGPLWKRIVPIASTAILAALITHLFDRNLQQTPSAPVTRFSMVLPEDQRFSALGRRSLAMSPDGTSIVYVANQQLYLRRLAEAEGRPIPGTSQNAGDVFFSPDGRWIGFVADGKLKKIAPTGGAPVTISDLELSPSGADWSSDDQIFIGQGDRGIVRVSANGGTPERVVTLKPGQRVHGPQILPGGDALLFSVADRTSQGGLWDNAQIVVHSLKSGDRRVVLTGGSDARYVQTGHLVYAVGSTLLGVRFDVQSLEVVGGPVPVVDDVMRFAAGNSTGGAQFAVSANGSVVYILQVAALERSLVLVDRVGNRNVLNLPARQYSQPRISPDGKQLAVATDGAVWISDLGGTAPLKRLTFSGVNNRPTWTRDGERVVFASEQGDGGLFWQRADGNGVAERLTAVEPGTTLQSESWSSDGKILIFDIRRSSPEGIGMLSVGANQEPSIVIGPPATHAALSRDGRWLAYHTEESGRPEVFVQPFPPNGTKYQVTTNGGGSPLWSPAAAELFYTTPLTRQIVSVEVQTEPGFRFGKATPLPIEGIAAPGPRPYDITPDGKQFLVMFPASQSDPNKAPPDQIQVILNWFEELKQRVPAN